MKIQKGTTRESVNPNGNCFIRADGKYCRYNSATRDALGDPKYITLAFDAGAIIITPSINPGDYKVTRDGPTRSFCIAALQNATQIELPKRTRIYGCVQDGKAVFKVIVAE